MSTWGQDEWGAHFNEANARRVAAQEPAREAQAARRAVHRALWVGLALLVLLVVAVLT